MPGRVGGPAHPRTRAISSISTRDVKRELGHADRTACVSAGIAKQVDEQVGASVDDRRRLIEPSVIRQAVPMRRPSSPWPLPVALTAIAVFTVLAIAVGGSPALALDSRAFTIADDLRAPWLDDAARAVTTLGLIAVVGPGVFVGAVILNRHAARRRAIVLVAGAALTWLSVWIVKSVVDRARPPAALVATSGQSFPSAHAANSVGWLALAMALTVVIPTRGGRIGVVAVGALVMVLVGLGRIYLRAHYASDVVAGEALAVAMYALSVAVRGRTRSGARPHPPDGRTR